MSPQFKSISQLSEMTGIDRQTLADYLSGINPIPGPKGSKLYWCPMIFPLIIEKKRKKFSPWHELVVDWFNQGLIQPKK